MAVGHICRMVAFEQMPRIAACGRIAPVEKVDLRRQYFAGQDRVGDTMGTLWRRPAFYLELAIAVSVYGAAPEPALRRSPDSDLGPKPSNRVKIVLNHFRVRSVAVARVGEGVISANLDPLNIARF